MPLVIPVTNGIIIPWFTSFVEPQWFVSLFKITIKNILNLEITLQIIDTSYYIVLLHTNSYIKWMHVHDNGFQEFNILIK